MLVVPIPTQPLFKKTVKVVPDTAIDPEVPAMVVPFHWGRVNPLLNVATPLTFKPVKNVSPKTFKSPENNPEEDGLTWILFKW